jgi:alpha-D-xyloside xylohydrolase
MQRFSLAATAVACLVLAGACGQAQSPAERLELDRKGETIVFEPYAPNILRVTLSAAAIRDRHQQVLQRLHAGRAHHVSTTPEGKKLLEMTGWSQAVPNHKDGTAALATTAAPPTRPSTSSARPSFRPTTSTTTAWARTTKGFLDHRGHPVHCWADYTAPAAPSFCVPFWSPTRATACCGTTRRRPPSSPASTSRPSGLPKSATGFRSL